MEFRGMPIVKIERKALRGGLLIDSELRSGAPSWFDPIRLATVKPVWPSRFLGFALVIKNLDLRRISKCLRSLIIFP